MPARKPIVFETMNHQLPRFAARFWALPLLALAGLPMLTSPAQADDLRDALISAYTKNPSLAAARANQRAVDEGVPQARAEALPSLSGQASYQENVYNNPDSSTSPTRIASAGVSTTWSVFAGGAVRNSIRAAETRVGAGRADLRGVEAGIFSAVVAAYMDVIRDEAIVGLNRANVGVLDVNLQATSDRFEIGDLTRTDVAQSDARLALARSDLELAESNLIRSREIYIQLVGDVPDALDPPPPLPNLPESPDAAVSVALENNPDLIAARERTKASEIDIDVAGSARLPRVEVFSNGSYANFLGSLSAGGFGTPLQQSQTGLTAGVRATFPIFQGGAIASRERQVQAIAGATMEQEIAVEREVIAATRASYASWRAANQVIVSSERAVSAATLSLEGVRAENSVGNRTILDILNAEQELLRAQVQLVSARRNAYVAGFNLLSAMGRAEARDLGLDGGVLYDPEVNYDRVSKIIWDWSKDSNPVAQSTRTVDTPAQTAIIGPR